MKRLSESRISREEFEKHYNQNNGFLPSTSVNNPILDEKSFFTSLEEGCDLLIKHRPDLVQYTWEDDSVSV